jgi:hypothetical protein
MKRVLGLLFCIFINPAFASEYNTPACYQSVPTSCGFNEMTLSLCNKEGQAKPTPV